jgi:hypothetical protein
VHQLGKILRMRNLVFERRSDLGGKGRFPDEVAVDLSFGAAQ